MHPPLSPFRCALDGSHQAEFIQGHQLALPRVTTHQALVWLPPRAQTKHQKPQSTRRVFHHRRKQRHHLPRNNAPVVSRRRYTIRRRRVRPGASRASSACIAHLIRVHHLCRFTTTKTIMTKKKRFALQHHRRRASMALASQSRRACFRLCTVSLVHHLLCAS